MTTKAINALKTISVVIFIVLSLALAVANPAAADGVAPLTTISLSGTQGSAGWFKSDVTVSLSATDMSNTGINRTEYSFNGSVWNRYTGPFNITKEGMTAVYYRSIDNASGVETAKMRVVSIDKTPPSITYSLTPAPNAKGWSNKTMLLHFETGDSVSGLTEHTSDTTLTNEGTYSSLTGIATDVAGNSVGVTVPTFYIDKTPPAVGNLTVAESTYVDTYISASAGVVEANPDRVEMDWGDGRVSLPSISKDIASSLHAYQYAGKYTVTLLVIDMAGNVARSSGQVTVSIPSNPTTPPEPTQAVMSTPTPTPEPTLVTPTPAPGFAMPLTGLTILAGAMLCLRARKKE